MELSCVLCDGEMNADAPEGESCVHCEDCGGHWTLRVSKEEDGAVRVEGAWDASFEMGGIEYDGEAIKEWISGAWEEDPARR